MSRSKRASRSKKPNPLYLPHKASSAPQANKVTDERTRMLVRSLVVWGIARGWTQHKTAEEIKARLGIEMHRANVGYIQQSIMLDAADRLIVEPKKALAAELLRIDKAIEALWDAWEHSSGNREINVSRVRRTALDQAGKPIGRASDVDDVMNRTEVRDPDPRYMTAIARFEELRSKLMGLLREPKDEDDKPPVPPSTINVHVKVGDGATLNMGAPVARDELPPPNGQVVDVTPKYAPALSAPAPPGTYR